MSSYYCNKCGAPIIDTNHGYITGCEHYPLTRMDALRALFQELLDRAVKAQTDPSEMVALIFRLKELIETVKNKPHK